ncbi:NADPH-adrenodoxin reductase [Balamuthia mandrillaris]
MQLGVVGRANAALARGGGNWIVVTAAGGAGGGGRLAHTPVTASAINACRRVAAAGIETGSDKRWRSSSATNPFAASASPSPNRTAQSFVGHTEEERDLSSHNPHHKPCWRSGSCHRIGRTRGTARRSYATRAKLSEEQEEEEEEEQEEEGNASDIALNTDPNECAHICVIGSGPAGFYTVEALLKQLGNHSHSTATTAEEKEKEDGTSHNPLPKYVKVDLYERLPVPFGLVRFGVAPDHPEVKVVTEKFERWMKDPRVSFLGNVQVGRDVSVAELLRNYHAIVFAYGAEEDRLLGVEGENLPGVHAAHKLAPIHAILWCILTRSATLAGTFVGWYNGEPRLRKQHFDLSCEKAVVIGQGNVALDVARILLQPLDVLEKTDIASHALDALRKSNVREVHIVGRRGPAQASFTNKELREILNLRSDNYVVDFQPDGVLQLNDASKEEIKQERGRKRMIDLLLKKQKEQEGKPHPATDNKGNNLRKVVLHYLKTPTRFLMDSNGKLAGLELERNRLEGEAGDQRAVSTGEKEILPCGIAFRSIGYRSVGIEGLPFDQKRGVVPNFGGRVTAPGAGKDEESTATRMYVSGWLKRGPSGVIGTNRIDAQETVVTLRQDIEQGRLTLGRSQQQPASSSTSASSSTPEQKEAFGQEAIEQLLQKRGVQVVRWHHWKQLEKFEEETGLKAGKPREKLTDLQQMLKIAFALQQQDQQ